MAPSASSQKSSTRGSSRYSLSNLASVGKALADVINKDNSTSDKASRKPRESKEDKDDAKAAKLHGRRSSGIPVDNDTARRRQSLNTKPGAKDAYAKDALSPGTTITRASRRTSVQPDGLAISEDGVIANKSATVSPGTARRASLRPRPANGSSALPKYRPRSMLVETSKKQPSPSSRVHRQPSSSDAESELTGEQEKELMKKHITPPRRNPRRRLSSSDDEREEKKAELKPPPEDRSRRSVSPLPKRARQTNIPVTLSPSTPVSKVKIPARKGASSPARDIPAARHPSPSRASPALGSKAERAKKSSIPRPPSSASSSSSAQQQQIRTPQTPQTPTPVRNMGRSASPSKTGSPLRQATSRVNESPLGKFAGRSKKTQLSPVQGSPAGAAFVEGDSMDSVADVEFMLGAAVSPTAPTPAIPRMRALHAFPEGLPETPSRPGLPSRSDMSYLSPLPPGSGHSPRAPRTARPGADRGSILSWDQLAAIGDRSLGVGEARTLLAEVPAPFSAPASPALSVLELPMRTPCTPESPALSTLPSPVGYGSISQVLLPDVTPSPAPVRLQYSQYSPADEAHAHAGDAAASLATMLRLQLAAVEQLAGERLAQVQALEVQLGRAADARMRDANELAGQVGALEDEMRAALEARDRAADEHTVRVAALEEQLRAEAAARDRTVRAAVERAAGDMARKQNAAVAQQGKRWAAACAAEKAAVRWVAVGETARGELELVAAGRDTLAVLLSGLEQLRRQLV
jgi:hypothetical protein